MSVGPNLVAGVDAERPEVVVKVRDLHVGLRRSAAAPVVHAVGGVSFDVCRGRTLGIVGESGCGKSTTAMSILRLLPRSADVRGEVVFGGRNLLEESEAALGKIRGRKISMIFQDPMVALDPLFTIGEQLAEPMREHLGLAGDELRARQIAMMEAVGIASPETRLRQYPHQLSGGQLQRVIGAIAIACDPELLIADEPTTALDPTAQAAYLELLERLSDSYGLALIIVTHDLGVVARVCDDVMVMYAGQVAEQAAVRDLFDHPRHPYTKALLASVPHGTDEQGLLPTIEGQPPDLTNLPPGCPFYARCAYGDTRCAEQRPPVAHFGSQQSRCWKADML
jgi:oligopeptide/dipeptide ABC transporter ATP-binding protein